jgi:hypothetical protein
MFPISVRLLSGEPSVVQVTAETSVKELRSRCIEKLPEFHTAMMCFGTNVLTESESVAEAGLYQDAEVQIIATPCKADALRAVGEAVADFVHFGEIVESKNWCKAGVLGPITAIVCQDAADAREALELSERASTALKVLCETDGWTEHERLLLWQVMKSPLACWHDTSEVFVKHLVEALAQACFENDESCQHTIPSLVWEATGCDEWRPIALEVLARYADSTTTEENLLGFPAGFLPACRKPGFPAGDFFKCFGREGYCKLLERLGTPDMDLAYLRKLSTISHLSPNNCAAIQAAANRALAAISKRGMMPLNRAACSNCGTANASNASNAEILPAQDETSVDHAETETDPRQEEQADLHRAILESRVTEPNMSAEQATENENSEGVVLYVLRRCAQAEEVAAALRTAPELHVCRTEVFEAGCELQPAFASGAWLLLPMTKDQLAEVQLEAKLASLKPWHVLMPAHHEEAVLQALQRVSKKKRPALKMLSSCAMSCKRKYSEEPQADDVNSQEAEADDTEAVDLGRRSGASSHAARDVAPPAPKVEAAEPATQCTGDGDSHQGVLLPGDLLDKLIIKRTFLSYKASQDSNTSTVPSVVSAPACVETCAGSSD